MENPAKAKIIPPGPPGSPQPFSGWVSGPPENGELSFGGNKHFYMAKSLSKGALAFEWPPDIYKVVTGYPFHVATHLALIQGDLLSELSYYTDILTHKVQALGQGSS